MALSTEDLNHLLKDAVARTEDVAALAQRICAVAAPTGDERRRAEFVAELWRERGYTPEIDEIGNVYVRRGKQGAQKPLLMLLSHIDTVFPVTTPLTIRREGDMVYGPGIGDNSVSVAAVLTAFEMLDAYGWETAVDLLAVANVGEEGLGDLRGARAAVERYSEDLGAVLVVDGSLGSIVNVAVGSKRWKITVKGPGGHSFGSFGVPSAIHGLGRIIAGLAALQVPKEPKTTFNVGVIEGGTSVNTIAAQASALLDMRSTDVDALDNLMEQARAVVLHQAGAGLKVEIEVLGDRPAGSRSENDPLVQLSKETLRWVGYQPRCVASSTDANIPISLNIPSVCIGVTKGEKAHTTEECMHVSPLGKGMAQLLRLCMEASELVAARQQ
ncbi:M20/M25/M40 family metallo-hydrolase [Dictyobacter kobayashii]|uniref:Peptidase M20 n=1 Tax=Dictyobacter kobayashii TaxID=2014872 RepID=A0A402ALW5_9CHLR|nr:M20/M25/M40 family metallo-hydrolase [Dictyobacter kobayashii]GCE20014.1 peptidase M20 [Dictyobacter kobayashii]